jgi:SecD/SecF fusion protein
VAALLTILGYSMYDTIIVFDRVRENVPRMPRAAFSQIVNRSMSEVLTRSLATSFCTLLPVVAILLFGGSTLKDFAFAIMIGIASGAYSSIFIASPVLTHWKEREGVYRNRRARLERDLGYVPAYATAIGEAPVDVEPPIEDRRGLRSASKRRGGVGGDIISEEPGEQLSREEFAELVRDIEPDVAEQSAPAGGSSRAAGLAARARLRRDRGNGAAKVDGDAQRAPEQKQGQEQEQRDSAADLTPEDLVLKDPPKPRRQRRSRNRRHGRAR